MMLDWALGGLYQSGRDCFCIGARNGGTMVIGVWGATLDFDGMWREACFRPPIVRLQQNTRRIHCDKDVS